MCVKWRFLRLGAMSIYAYHSGCLELAQRNSNIAFPAFWAIVWIPIMAQAAWNQLILGFTDFRAMFFLLLKNGNHV